MPPSVSLIIPALNEVGTIEGVVRAAISSGLFLEVIVVDDGSEDDTADLAQKAGATIVAFCQNRGKGFATREGCLRSRGDLIMCWDADLNKTTTDSFRKLLDELAEGYDLVVGVLPEPSQRMFKQWSGQRVLTRRLMMSFLAENSNIDSFAIDSRLIKWAIDRKLKIGYVKLSGIKHVRKCAKRGVIRGLWQYFRMWWEIFRGK